MKSQKLRDKVPDNWTIGIGSSGETFYDAWFYHVDDKAEIHIFWDKGNDYVVELIPIKEHKENDDPIYDYPKNTCEFETLEEAEEYAVQLMQDFSPN